MSADETPEAKVKRLEALGTLVPDCLFCQDHIYPSVLAGKGLPFAPSHRTFNGHAPHCTCDSCF